MNPQIQFRFRWMRDRISTKVDLWTGICISFRPHWTGRKATSCSVCISAHCPRYGLRSRFRRRRHCQSSLAAADSVSDNHQPQWRELKPYQIDATVSNCNLLDSLIDCVITIRLGFRTCVGHDARIIDTIQRYPCLPPVTCFSVRSTVANIHDINRYCHAY